MGTYVTDPITRTVAALASQFPGSCGLIRLCRQLFGGDLNPISNQSKIAVFRVKFGCILVGVNGELPVFIHVVIFCYFVGIVDLSFSFYLFFGCPCDLPKIQSHIRKTQKFQLGDFEFPKL
jgi:hypothetical protein